MKPVIGIDLGASQVRVVQVAGIDSAGFAVVRRIGLAPVKDGAIVGGVIKNPQLVSVALTQAVREAGVRPYGAVLGISSEDVVLGAIQLPAVLKPHERTNTIRLRGMEFASNQSTIDLDSAELSTFVMGPITSGEGVLMDNLLVTAVPSQRVEDVMNVCRLARVTPRAIDLSGAASVRALIRTDPKLTGEVSTIVDVGHSKITVATRQGAFLRSLRTYVGGGADITRAIQSTGTEPATANEMKQRIRIDAAQQLADTVRPHSSYLADEQDDAPADSLTQTNIESAVSRAADRMIEVISNAVEADASDFPTQAYTQGIVLCGSGSLLGGFKELLSRRLNLNVHVGRPWALIEHNRRTEFFFQHGAEDPALLFSLTTAIGLGLWQEVKQ